MLPVYTYRVLMSRALSHAQRAGEWQRWSAIVAAMQSAKIITSKEIGLIIRKSRIELGISQERLAEVLDVSYQQVQRYESGKNRLNVEKLQLIAQALRMPVEHFFRREYPEIAAEVSPAYGSDEEKNLLKHFRRIASNADKAVVVGVARLAAKR